MALEQPLGQGAQLSGARADLVPVEVELALHLCLASIRTSVLIDHANAESGIGTVVLSSRVAQTKTRNWRT